MYIRTKQINKNTLHYIALRSRDNKPILQHEALLLMNSTGSEGFTFRELLRKTLQMCPLQYFDIEHPPMTLSSITRRPFEFVLVSKNPILKYSKPDIKTYKSHIKKQKTKIVNVFDPLNKFIVWMDDKSIVIVPKPEYYKKNLKDYSSLSMYIQNAKINDVHDIFKFTANLMLHNMKKRPIWLNTCSKVSWLTIRLDTDVSCYKYKPYKTLYNLFV